jgi:hypothetical protein
VWESVLRVSPTPVWGGDGRGRGLPRAGRAGAAARPCAPMPLRLWLCGRSGPAAGPSGPLRTGAR